MSESQLQQLESQVAFRPASELEFKDIAVVGSDVQQRISRGLSGVAVSPKRPLTAEFEKALDSGFDAYYGLAFPHQ
jgi:hypothetical protein